MKLTFEQMFEALMKLEGFKSNNPNDPGGETTWGISKVYHPEMYVDGPPSRTEAYDFYHREYYIEMRLSEMESGRLAFEILEASVLCGKVTAVMFAQKAFNLIRFPDMKALVVDGQLGPKSLAAFNWAAMHYERAMYRAMNYFEAQHFAETKSIHFIRGWFGRRLDDADFISN